MNPPKWLSLSALALVTWFGAACSGQQTMPMQISTPTSDRGPSPPFASPSDIAALVPADGASVDIMQLAYPRRFVELSIKLKRGVAENPEWWINAVETAPRGEPVPYDPRLGLTRDEYDEYLAVGKRATLSKVKSTSLRVTRAGNRFTFDGGKDLPDLTGVELDLTSDIVRTSFGIARQRSAIEASEGQTWTGPWGGTEWTLEKPGAELGSGTFVHFALGKLTKTGRGILYYEVKQGNGQTAKSLLVVLYYDLNASP